MKLKHNNSYNMSLPFLPYRRPRSYSRVAIAMLANKVPGFNRISRRKRSRIGLAPTVYQNNAEGARIILNVSGRRFETDRWTLRTFADTRLAWMAMNPAAHQEYDTTRGEFVIDRHAGCFEFILNFYRTGKLHMPTDVCGPLFEDELNYWGVDERLLEPCCWSRYKTYRDTEDRMRKMLHETQQPYAASSDSNNSGAGSDALSQTSDGRSESNHAILHNIIDFLDDQNEKRENRLLYYWKKIRKILWAVLDNSHRSIAARIYTTISLTMIAIYISVFCLETINELRVPKVANNGNHHYSSDYYGGAGETISNSNNDTGVPSFYNSDSSQPPKDASSQSLLLLDSAAAKDSPLRFRSRTKPHIVLVVLDYACVAFFTLELILHMAVCPRPWKLFKSFLTWVDIATIIPIYFVMVFEAVTEDESDESTKLIIELIKSIKILRILLIFKIANNFTGVRVLWYTFRASAKELVMLIFFLAIGVLFSGVLIYYAETMFGTRNSEFDSIPIGFWWGLVTMTTLGYGDFYPKTLPGYIVGASCAIIGVLVIALPIPVIVNNFTVYYAHAQALSSMPARPKVVLAASAARRLQSIPASSDVESAGARTPSLATTLGLSFNNPSNPANVPPPPPPAPHDGSSSSSTAAAAMVRHPLTGGGQTISFYQQQQNQPKSPSKHFTTWESNNNNQHRRQNLRGLLQKLSSTSSVISLRSNPPGGNANNRFGISKTQSVGAINNIDETSNNDVIDESANIKNRGRSSKTNIDIEKNGDRFSTTIPLLPISSNKVRTGSSASEPDVDGAGVGSSSMPILSQDEAGDEAGDDNSIRYVTTRPAPSTNVTTASASVHQHPRRSALSSHRQPLSWSQRSPQRRQQERRRLTFAVIPDVEHDIDSFS